MPTFKPGWMSGGECAAADARTGRKDGENSSKPAEQDAIPACFSKVPFGLFLRKREEHFAGSPCGRSLRRLENGASLPQTKRMF